MNDQSQMMNQAQPQLINHPPVIIAQPQILNQSQVMNQPQLMNQSKILSQPQLMKQSRMMAQSQVINPQPHVPQPQLLNQSQMMMMSQSQPMLNRGYKRWSYPRPPVDSTNIQFQGSLNPNFVNQNQLNLGRSNWKGKKVTDKRKDLRRMETQVPSSSIIGPGNTGGHIPPSLHDLQSQNRLKSRKFYPKKQYNNRFAPYAPRNTTSFLIRAKKAGGIASLVSPSPVTPAVLPTPKFSPSREVLVDMAKEEWGVDSYGSMKGLIRLRSPGNEAEVLEEEEEEEGDGSSESDVEEHVEMERRLDHDLSRFEMIYPSYGVEYNNILENRVDDQDSHISQLEEENLTLKERLFLMETELSDLRRRMQFLERHSQTVEYANEEVVENESENESDEALDVAEMGENGRNLDVDSNRNNVELGKNENSEGIGMEICTPSSRNGDEKVRKEFVSSSGLVTEKNEEEEENGSEPVESENKSSDEEIRHSFELDEQVMEDAR